MAARNAALSVSLPRPLRRFVEQRVAGGGFGNVSEYIRTLIRGDQEGAQRPPLPGLRSRQRSTPTSKLREHGQPVAAVIDFSAEQWRELREALHSGELRLMARRLAEVADLWRSALELRRAALRQEFPGASEADLDERLAACVQEMAQEPEDPALVSAPERLARILRG